ncbi:unnamed protein product [Closterium sp. NIES-65]|nr:unnamed protein product [Closterium sp. NIES-65]
MEDKAFFGGKPIPDVVSLHTDSGKTWVMDVVIADPHDNNANCPETKPGAALNEAVRRKKATYKEAVTKGGKRMEKTTKVIPLATEIYGGWSNSFSDCVKDIAATTSKRLGRQSGQTTDLKFLICRSIAQRIGVTQQRSQAVMIRHRLRAAVEAKGETMYQDAGKTFDWMGSQPSAPCDIVSAGGEDATPPEAEMDDLDALAADIPCDTLAAVHFLRASFPPSLSKVASSLPPFALLSQIYTVVPHRTTVDRELEMLQRSGSVRVIRLMSARTDIAVLLSQDYAQVVEAARQQFLQRASSHAGNIAPLAQKGDSSSRGNSGGYRNKSSYRQENSRRKRGTSETESSQVAVFYWFRDRVLPQCTEHGISRQQLERLLSNAGKSRVTDSHICILVQAGLLVAQVAHVDSYWFSLPNIGSFTQHLTKVSLQDDIFPDFFFRDALHLWHEYVLNTWQRVVSLAALEWITTILPMAQAEDEERQRRATARRESRQRRREARVAEWVEEIRAMFDEEFEDTFRITREVLDLIAEKMAHPMSRFVEYNNVPLSLCCLIPIKYFASAMTYHDMSFMFGLPKGLIHRIVDCFLVWFPRKFKRDWVQFPSEELREEMALDFRAIKGVPNVIGAIDGTQIEIRG